MPLLWCSESGCFKSSLLGQTMSREIENRRSVQDKSAQKLCFAHPWGGLPQWWQTRAWKRQSLSKQGHPGPTANFPSEEHKGNPSSGRAERTVEERAECTLTSVSRASMLGPPSIIYVQINSKYNHNWVYFTHRCNSGMAGGRLVKVFGC